METEVCARQKCAPDRSVRQTEVCPRQKCAPDRRRCSCYREWKTKTGAKRKLMEDGGPNKERIKE